MSVLKQDFDLLLEHPDWDEKTILCIKELHANLNTYKYLLNKYTISNISDILKIANNLKNELTEKKQKINELMEKIETLYEMLNEKK